MDYELAKQLKDVGFPQPQYDDAEYIDSDETTSGWLTTHWLNGRIAYVPTLSELIEACGDMFGQLVKYDPDKGQRWIAIGEYPRWETNGESRVERIEAATPEEAVAKLWLALNASASKAQKSSGG
jgi:hypothetical protein